MSGSVDVPSVEPADATLLRSARYIEHAQDCSVWGTGDESDACTCGLAGYLARLHALASWLDRYGGAVPRYACNYCGTVYAGPVTPEERCVRPVDVEHDGHVTHTTCACPLVLSPPEVDSQRGRVG